MRRKKAVTIWLLIVSLVISVVTIGTVLVTNKSRIIYCADYKKIHCQTNEVNVTNEDLQEYLKVIYDGYSSLVTTTKTIVSNGDVVQIDCTVYENDVVVNSVTGLDVLVGANKFNQHVERNIIGCEVDTSTDIETNGQLFHITIIAIKKFIIPDFHSQDFLSENFGVKDYDSFLSLMNDNVYKQKINESNINTKNNIFDIMIDKSLIFLKEEDIKDTYKKHVDNYRELSSLYGLTLEEYINERLNMSISSFVEKCKDESCRDLKIQLISMHIWNKLNTSVKEELLRDYNVSVTIDDISTSDIVCCIGDYLMHQCTLSNSFTD